MFKYLTTKFIGGITIGIGIVLVLGVFIWVQAVDPGVVTNPTFGPQDDDVNFATEVYPQKICSIWVPFSWRDNMVVGDGWTAADCNSWRAAMGGTNYGLYCLLEDGYSLNSADCW